MTRTSQSPGTPEDERAVFEDLLTRTGKQRYVLQLFISGLTPRSTLALATVRALCEEYLPGCYDLEVIDIYQQPAIARSEQVVAVPLLVRKLPNPTRRVIGDLSRKDRVLLGLELGLNRTA